MARSIRDIGEKLEKVVVSEEAKREGETLKDVIKSLPSDVKVRIMKIQDGVKRYISTVPIDDYDKSDPYAWIKRRFVQKHGDGEYIIEFIAPSGEIIKQTSPIFIESENKKEDIEKQAFIKKAEEALRLKEEAIEKKQEIAEKISKLESEKAAVMATLFEKQFDMLTKLYEERINAIKEQIEKGTNDNNILFMIETLKNEYRQAVDRLSNLIKEAAENKQPQYMELIFNMINKSLEKNTLEETLKVISLIKDITRNENSIDNIMKFINIFKEISSNNNEDPIDRFAKTINIVKEITTKEEQKSFFEELIENPQKLEIIKNLLGIKEIRQVEEKINELVTKISMRDEPERIKNDPLTELLDDVDKIKKIKDVLAPIFGIQPQPAKSILELVSNIINSPTMPEIVSRIMEGLTKAKLIESGFLPAEYAGSVIHVNTLKGNKAKQKMETQEGGSSKIKKQKMEDGKLILKHVLVEAIQKAASNSKADDTPEDFGNKIAEALYKIAKSNPAILAIAIAIKKKEKEKIAKETLKELIPDIPDDMMETIIKSAENKIKEMVGKNL